MKPKKLPAKPTGVKKGPPGPELYSHVFGPEDSAEIGRLFAQSLRLMSEVCTNCDLKPDATKPFEWAIVAPVTPRNGINTNAVYIVQLKDLHTERSVTLDLGTDDGASRVSSKQYKLFILSCLRIIIEIN